MKKYLQYVDSYGDLKSLNEMIGETFTKVTADKESLTFSNSEVTIVFNHHQNCCESVEIDDICGVLSDLQNTPILDVKELVSTKESDKKYCDDSETWTFYDFRTVKGSVTVKWYGTSNGYYSEEVDIDIKNNNCHYLIQ